MGSRVKGSGSRTWGRVKYVDSRVQDLGFGNYLAKKEGMPVYTPYSFISTSSHTQPLARRVGLSK